MKLAKQLQKIISGWGLGKNKGTVKQTAHYTGDSAYTKLSDGKESRGRYGWNGRGQKKKYKTAMQV